MTTFFAKSYGPYSYNGAVATDDTLGTVEQALSVRSQTAPSAGKGGRYSGGTVFDRLDLTLTGQVVGSRGGRDINDPGSVRAAWDELVGAHRPGAARPFQIDGDRYCNAEVSSELRASAWNGLPVRSYSVTLTSYEDPPWFAAAPSSAVLNTSGATALTTGGNGPADPTVSLQVTGAGGTLTVQDAYGNTLTVQPASTGTLVINSYAETVTLNGADVFGQSSGAFPRLPPGPASLSISPGGCALGGVSVTWQDRWY